ncbi:MAG: ABC transporter permease [Gammaproteobacteria bacterium]|nr:ABC transporter permease [Gammaproteobacteria bacterium]
MPFQWFVALRYMRDARGQTALILSAVSVGVSVIVFLSALINGLQSSLIETTLGSQPHVTLRVPREEPRPLVEPNSERAIARLIQPASQRLRSIDQWPVVMADAQRVRGVTAASPTVTGSGIATRADARLPVVIRGVDRERFLAIINIPKKMVQGTFDIAADGVVIGSTLATDLGVEVGDKVRVASTEGVEEVMKISGVFTLGSAAVDKTWVVMSLRHAQSMFALPGGATTIELKVADVFDADRIANQIQSQTGLLADSWMALNAQLLSGLSAQSSSKVMIQVCVVLTVALGIASVLIVSVVQKSREIGILRAVGAPANRVLAIFLIQGGVLGLVGSFLGSALGVAFASIFETLTSDPNGLPRFPVQVDLNLLVSATALATGVGLITAVIPALRAARLDPSTAIRGG